MTCIADSINTVNRAHGYFLALAIFFKSLPWVFRDRLDLCDLLDTLEVLLELVPVLDQSDPVCITLISLLFDKLAGLQRKSLDRQDVLFLEGEPQVLVNFG